MKPKKINEHFVDQVIIRAGLTEKKATELYNILIKALNHPNKEQYLQKVETLTNNRTMYKFVYDKTKTGYCVVDNLKRTPITFFTHIIAQKQIEANQKRKQNTRNLRAKTEFKRYMGNMKGIHP